jgi:Bacterial Ig-like domain (group 1)
MFVASGQTARGVGRVLLAGMLAVLAALALAASATAATSTSVGYVSDFGKESANDPAFTGSSIFVNALTGSPPGATYTTADKSKTVTLTDVPVKAIDAGGVAALAPFDTLILYEVCDIASHPKTIEAINTFLTNGGKVMIFDADRCAEGVGGKANYSSFLFPFETNSPGPKGAEGSYITVVPSTLTTGLSVGPQEFDAVGDANIFTSFSGAWCASITAENVEKAKGFVEATAQTPSGGLVIYEGEDNWFTDKPSAHLQLVFDDMLKQNWAPAGLPCTIPASGITLSPPSQTHTTGSTATVTAKVVDIEGKPVEGVEVEFEVESGPNKGKTGKGTTNASGEATFSYTGGPTTGTDKVIASFVDSLKNKHTSNTVDVIWEDAPITAAGENLSGTEGAEASGTVATFTDPDKSATASEYSASIEWGDGATSAGTVSGGGGSFAVSGKHTYAEEGSYTITVAITDVDNSSNSAKTSSTATVADAALASECATPATTVQAFAGPTATFTDADPGGMSSDYTAKVEWGDGTESAGTVSAGTGPGPYTVSGSHAYSSTGPFTITTTITDAGGSKTVATCRTLVFAFAPGGGSFVIGDENSATGTLVSFWGAKWWKNNSLSGGSAPPSFKGFAENPATPSCGTGWSTDPGNSTPPPNGPLPADMGIIVASKITKSGSQIAGDTVHIVVVKTNPGYRPNPGHAGTGTVEAQVC